LIFSELEGEKNCMCYIFLYLFLKFILNVTLNITYLYVSGLSFPKIRLNSLVQCIYIWAFHYHWFILQCYHLWIYSMKWQTDELERIQKEEAIA